MNWNTILYVLHCWRFCMDCSWEVIWITHSQHKLCGIQFCIKGLPLFVWNSTLFWLLRELLHGRKYTTEMLSFVWLIQSAVVGRIKKNVPLCPYNKMDECISNRNVPYYRFHDCEFPRHLLSLNLIINPYHNSVALSASLLCSGSVVSWLERWQDHWGGRSAAPHGLSLQSTRRPQSRYSPQTAHVQTGCCQLRPTTAEGAAAKQMSLGLLLHWYSRAKARA